jgi:hypothetical protein
MSDTGGRVGLREPQTKLYKTRENLQLTKLPTHWQDPTKLCQSPAALAEAIWGLSEFREI